MFGFFFENEFAFTQFGFCFLPLLVAFQTKGEGRKRGEKDFFFVVKRREEKRGFNHEEARNDSR